jgi:hypothetical protein
MKVDFHITVDKNIKMNLNQTSFCPTITEYRPDHQLVVRVLKNDVSALAVENSSCIIEVPNDFKIQGVIEKITEKNGSLHFLCSIPSGICRKIYNHFHKTIQAYS